jgi:hypothetical protein
LNQILKRQTSRFHYGSKVPAVTIAVFITILEQNQIIEDLENRKSEPVTPVSIPEIEKSIKKMKTGK